MSKGLKKVAPFMGILSSAVNISALGIVFYNGSISPVNIFAYASGFGLGSYIGLIIEERISLGFCMVRVITQERDGLALVKYLRRLKLGVTYVDAKGRQGTNVHIVLTIIRKRKLKKVLRAVTRCNPKAFYSVEDIRSVQQVI